MTDLALLVPSRGRPKNVARLIEACEKTCRASTVIHFGFDNDDDREANVGAASQSRRPPWRTAAADARPARLSVERDVDGSASAAASSTSARAR